MLAANDAPIMSPSKILLLPALFDPPVPSSPPPLEEGSLNPLDINDIDNSDPIRPKALLRGGANSNSLSLDSSHDHFEFKHNDSNLLRTNSEMTGNQNLSVELTEDQNFSVEYACHSSRPE